MSGLNMSTRVRLNNGVEMPILGLGVFQVASGKTTYQTVRTAIEVGYRLIDTASYYGNEVDVGKAVKDSGIPRDDLFVTTKVWNTDHGYEETIRAFDRSLRLLRMDYVDLYLIHWPRSPKRGETWRALEHLYEQRRCRAIGVSNYTVRHLDELLASRTTVPVIDQVEFSPYLYQKDLLEYCTAHGIQLEAYSPLVRGRKFSDPRLLSIAAKYQRSPAQMLIRWVLQKGVVVIPKSTHRERIIENTRVFDFEIGGEDMTTLDSFNENLHTTYDPAQIP